MNPQNMKRLMKQMGINTEEIPAKKAIFELDDKLIVIENPNVTAMTIQGQKTYTVMGQAKEESKKGASQNLQNSREIELPKEDIEMVASSAGVSFTEAEKALKQSDGDLAKAIEKLKK